MNTKLTLKLDKAIIEQAKEYASQKQISLSKIVEDYFKMLTQSSNNYVNEIEISPYVKSIASGKELDYSDDYKKEHKEHKLKKHS